MSEEFRWVKGSVKEFQYLYVGTRYLAWLDAFREDEGYFWSMPFVREVQQCACESVEEAKLFIEAQCLLNSDPIKLEIGNVYGMEVIKSKKMVDTKC